MKIGKIIKKINTLSPFQQVQIALLVSDIAFTINDMNLRKGETFFPGDYIYIAMRDGKASLFNRKVSVYAAHYYLISKSYSLIIDQNNNDRVKILATVYARAAIHSATFLAMNLSLFPKGSFYSNNDTLFNVLKYSIKAGVKKKTIMKIINNFN